jgi:hypothetical protein
VCTLKSRNGKKYTPFLVKSLYNGSKPTRSDLCSNCGSLASPSYTSRSTHLIQVCSDVALRTTYDRVLLEAVCRQCFACSVYSKLSFCCSSGQQWQHSVPTADSSRSTTRQPYWCCTIRLAVAVALLAALVTVIDIRVFRCYLLSFISKC